MTEFDHIPGTRFHALANNKRYRAERDHDGGRIRFRCPACNRYHEINRGWQHDGNWENPTFTPSVKVTGVKDLTDEEADRIFAGENIKPIPTICHSFVRAGKIQYLPDCTHSMAGQTVELPFMDGDDV